MSGSLDTHQAPRQKTAFSVVAGWLSRSEMSSEAKNTGGVTGILVVLPLPRRRKHCHRRGCRVGTVCLMNENS